MKVTPFFGIDGLLLGSTKEQVRRLRGEPDAIEQEEWSDGTRFEIWSYHIEGLELNFASEDNYRLVTITTTSSDAILECIKPIGLKEKELTELLPSVKLDEDFEESGKNYTYSDKEISFWTSGGVVVNLTLFPKYDETGNIPIWPYVKSQQTNHGRRND